MESKIPVMIMSQEWGVPVEMYPMRPLVEDFEIWVAFHLIQSSTLGNFLEVKHMHVTADFVVPAIVANTK